MHAEGGGGRVFGGAGVQGRRSPWGRRRDLGIGGGGKGEGEGEGGGHLVGSRLIS